MAYIRSGAVAFALSLVLGLGCLPGNEPPERLHPGAADAASSVVKRDARPPALPTPDAAPVLTAADAAAALPDVAPVTSVDGGTMNGGAPDGSGGTPGKPGAPGGPSRCADTASIACLSFEEALPNGFAISGGTIETSADRVFRGTKSLRMVGGSGSPRLIGTNVFKGGRVWGRAFMFYDRAPTGGHTNLTHASGPGPRGTSYYRIGLKANPTGFMSTFLVKNPFQEEVAECTKAPFCTPEEIGSTAIPVNRWFCLEWEFDATTGGKPTRLFMDGKALPLRAYNPDRWPKMTFQDLFFGYERNSGSAGSWTFWVDELALGEQQIGCDR